MAWYALIDPNNHSTDHPILLPTPFIFAGQRVMIREGEVIDPATKQQQKESLEQQHS